MLLMRKLFKLSESLDNEKANIFKPSFHKIIFTLIFYIMPVIGWITIMKYGKENLTLILLYFSLTFVWIIISSIISSVLTYASHRNRLTKTTYFYLLLFLSLYVTTILNSFFGNILW